jgi:hypothetical protein
MWFQRRVPHVILALCAPWDFSPGAAGLGFSDVYLSRCGTWVPLPIDLHGPQGNVISLVGVVMLFQRPALHVIAALAPTEDMQRLAKLRTTIC